MNEEELFKYAKTAVKKMPVNTHFTLKELMGSKWLPLSKGERIRFGKNFKAAVLDGEIDNVFYVNKKANNSASYEKRG